MKISESTFEQLLPDYLLSTEKNRIKAGLEQFYHDGAIDYASFYVDGRSYLMQGDILESVKAIDWDDETEEYINGYMPAILLSNSCDVSQENSRAINKKNALVAPIIPLPDWLEDLQQNGFTNTQIDNFQNTLRRQEYTNLLYLPAFRSESPEYIARLDRIHWLPESQIAHISADLSSSRQISFSNWGYYLLVVKVSLHFCRVPEEVERPTMEDGQ